jgi:hypothetical protein
MKGLLVDRNTMGVIVAARSHAQVSSEYRVLCSPDAVVRFNRRPSRVGRRCFSVPRPDSPRAVEPRQAQRAFRF